MNTEKDNILIFITYINSLFRNTSYFNITEWETGAYKWIKGVILINGWMSKPIKENEIGIEIRISNKIENNDNIVRFYCRTNKPNPPFKVFLKIWLEEIIKKPLQLSEIINLMNKEI